jgi:hypothetical protein
MPKEREKPSSATCVLPASISRQTVPAKITPAEATLGPANPTGARLLRGARRCPSPHRSPGHDLPAAALGHGSCCATATQA